LKNACFVNCFSSLLRLYMQTHLKIVSCKPTMFERLQKKWKVGGLQLALIISTFAIGGSLTGFAGKKIMNVLNIQLDWLWAVIYILLVTIIWPVMVVIVSIPFGQYRFFTGYIRKIGEKMGLVKKKEN
jgi:hypothetical protein